MDNKSDLLMLRGVLAGCAECGVEQVFVPVDAGDPDGAFCCTSCDAAVFLIAMSVDGRWDRQRDRGAA